MRAKTLAALLLLALNAILAACQGAEEEVTPSPTPPLEAQLRQQLEELSTDALLALTFPGVALAPLGSGDPFPIYDVEDEPSWIIAVLGRLIGHLTRPDQPQLAAFLHLHGPVTDGEEPSESQVLELPEGLFMALIELDSHEQPALAGLSLLDSSAAEIMEPAPALKQGLRPFHQSLDNLAPDGLMSPALAVDTDNDGLDELVLLDAGMSDGVAAAFYLTFRWTGSGLHWQRAAPPLEGASANMPTQTVLDYLAAVAAATVTAEPWQDFQRFLVWQWLTSTDEPISEELLHEIADDDSEAALAAARRKLEATRALFKEAFNLQSPDRQKLQPWSDFVNGFRNATGTAVEEMMPPSQEDEQMSVQVVIMAFSREGPDMVQRRFRITYELVQSEEGWRLDDVDAKEERLPE
ncbi:MAG: hypothetical protein JSU97_01140 [Dehalococcoidia bacterium]|nr:MAG: hypothetical protein JSU97_01140 [Dehalococcoidia bacterium]